MGLSTLHKPPGGYLSSSWRRAIVVIIFSVSVCLGIPYFLFAGVGEVEFVYNGNNMTSIVCRLRSDHHLQPVYYGVLAFVLSVNIVCIFILYICIAVVVYQRNKNKGTRQPKSPARSDKESTQTTEDIELDSIESLPRNVKTKNSVDHSNEVTSRNAGKSSTPSPSTQFNKMFVTIVVAYVLSFLPGGIILLFLITVATELVTLQCIS